VDIRREVRWLFVNDEIGLLYILVGGRKEWREGGEKGGEIKAN
jgi:hypothetical protein